MSTAEIETTETDALFERAMKLSEKARLSLSERLILSVPPPGASRTAEEWDAEIKRRIEEYEKDPSRVIPASEVLTHVEERIEKVRRLQGRG